MTLTSFSFMLTEDRCWVINVSWVQSVLCVIRVCSWAWRSTKPPASSSYSSVHFELALTHVSTHRVHGNRSERSVSGWASVGATTAPALIYFLWPLTAAASLVSLRRTGGGEWRGGAVIFWICEQLSGSGVNYQGWGVKRLLLSHCFSSVLLPDNESDASFSLRTISHKYLRASWFGWFQDRNIFFLYFYRFEGIVCILSVFCRGCFLVLMVTLSLLYVNILPTVCLIVWSRSDIWQKLFLWPSFIWGYEVKIHLSPHHLDETEED